MFNKYWCLLLLYKIITLFYDRFCYFSCLNTKRIKKKLFWFKKNVLSLWNALVSRLISYRESLYLKAQRNKWWNVQMQRFIHPPIFLLLHMIFQVYIKEDNLCDLRFSDWKKGPVQDWKGSTVFYRVIQSCTELVLEKSTVQVLDFPYVCFFNTLQMFLKQLLLKRKRV